MTDTERPPVTAEGFRDALRAGVLRWGGAEWVADRVDGDAVIVLFRQPLRQGPELVPGPLEGTRLVFDEFAAVVLGPGRHAIADVLGEAVLEIVEPAGFGVRLDVPWADGLCDDPGSVLWGPDAAEAAADRP